MMKVLFDELMQIADTLYQQHKDFSRTSVEYYETYARSVMCLGMCKKGTRTSKRDLVHYYEQLSQASWDALTYYLLAIHARSEIFGTTGEQMNIIIAKYKRMRVDYSKLTDFDDIEDSFLD